MTVKLQKKSRGKPSLRSGFLTCLKHPTLVGNSLVLGSVRVLSLRSTLTHFHPRFDCSLRSPGVGESGSAALTRDGRMLL